MFTPEIYDSILQPILGAPFTAEMTARAATKRPSRILETACGTGAITYALAAVLPKAQISATDVNQAMIDYARSKDSTATIAWRKADALDLPFAAHSFDLVLSQFGVMFFPDKLRAMGEARRVLRPRGAFVFSVWDDLSLNELQRVAAEALAALFPDDPPTYARRLPFGYNERARIEKDLGEAGFATIVIEEIRKRVEVANARDYAVGACQGGGARSEIEAREPDGVGRATDFVEAALIRHFGGSSFEVSAQTLFVTAS